MEVFAAAGHIVGAIIGYVTLTFAGLAIAEKLKARYMRKLLRDLRLKTGADTDAEVDELGLPIMAEKYSSEHFVNRVTDFLGILADIWGYISLVVMLLILGAAIWESFDSGPDHAVIAWGVLPAQAFFMISAMIFFYACYVLFGRFPGEASKMRKALEETFQGGHSRPKP